MPAPFDSRDARPVLQMHRCNPVARWQGIAKGLHTSRAVTLSAAPNACVGSQGTEVRVIWTVIAILTVLWLIALALDIAGAFVNVLLVIAAAVLVVELVRRARAPA